jgi:hypothetical protein
VLVEGTPEGVREAARQGGAQPAKGREGKGREGAMVSVAGREGLPVQHVQPRVLLHLHCGNTYAAAHCCCVLAVRFRIRWEPVVHLSPIAVVYALRFRCVSASCSGLAALQLPLS